MEPTAASLSPNQSWWPPSKKKIVIWIAIFIAFLAIGGGIAAYFYFQPKQSVPIVPVSVVINLTPTLIPTPPKDAQTLNILLLGYGGAGHQGGYLTDALVLAHFDFEQKVLALIAIPRDSWVAFPDGISRKINAAFALKTNTNDYTKSQLDSSTANHAGAAAKAVVETITGFPVNYFIGIDFVGFERAISSLGGIEVNVLTPLDDPWYPTRGLELELCGWSPEEVTKMTATMSGFTLEKQFPCRYERVKYDRGVHHLDGGQTLKFTRSRHSSSDFARGERQQAVLIGLKEKLTSLGALDNLPKFFNELAQETRTDLNLDVINYLAPTLRSIPGLRVVNISLNSANVLKDSKASSGAYILIPKTGDGNWQAVQQFIQNELNTVPASTPTLTQIRELN
jgi:polyisoprenyl-teichoic acid--peptidoglycan teichoic acid transferase